MPKQSQSDLTARIRRTLEETVASVASQDNLQPLCGFVEQLLLHSVSAEILQELAAIAKRKTVPFVVADPQTFQWGGSVYELRAGLAQQSGRCLEVVLAPTRQFEPSLMGQVHHIDGVGRVKEFRVLLPQIFEPHAEWIELTIKTIFETGYRLLNSHLQEGVEETQKAPAHALYGHVRSVLPGELAGTVKLNTIVETEGVYLFDREAFSGSVRAAHAANLLSSKSPLDVVINVCTTPVPFEQMFSKDALKADAVIEANLLQAKYRENGNGTHISEMALYGSQHASVQPLVKTDKICLVGAYPAALRRRIEPALAAERSKFEQLIAQHSKGLREVMNRIAAQTKQPITKVMETGAGLLGAFTGAGFAEFLRDMR